MNTKEPYQFPVFLKYRKHQTFFRIISPQSFEELKIAGKYFSLTIFTAKILPERVFISDMLENKEGRWETITEKEFNKYLENARKDLKELPV